MGYQNIKHMKRSKYLVVDVLVLWNGPKWKVILFLTKITSSRQDANYLYLQHVLCKKMLSIHVTFHSFRQKHWDQKDFLQNFGVSFIHYNHSIFFTTTSINQIVII